VIYAHLLSLMLWPKILNRTLNIAAAAQAAAPPPPNGKGR
jgi:hypothetical protein